MTKENRPLDPDYISACLEEAIKISNRQERERLQRVSRAGTGGIAGLLNRSGAAVMQFARSERAATSRN